MITEAKIKTPEKLHENKPVDSLKLSGLKILLVKSTAKRTRKRRPPVGRITSHVSKHRKYYYFARGSREVYLGSAEAILKAVKGENGSS